MTWPCVNSIAAIVSTRPGRKLTSDGVMTRTGSSRTRRLQQRPRQDCDRERGDDRQRVADDRAGTADDDQHSDDGTEYGICGDRGDRRVERHPEPERQHDVADHLHDRVKPRCRGADLVKRAAARCADRGCLADRLDDQLVDRADLIEPQRVGLDGVDFGRASSRRRVG